MVNLSDLLWGNIKQGQSFGVVDPVVERLGSPEGVGVVELEEVDARSGIVVRARVDLLRIFP